MAPEIIRGTVITSADPDTLSVTEGAYVVTEGGFIREICTSLPQDLTSLPVTDYGDALIIPAFSDLHIHASQYAMRGTEMDRLLFDWLDHVTFPHESRFEDPAYAKEVYTAVVQDLIRNGTFHASLFATIHRESCDILFDLLARYGLQAYVGKVNMDRNSPPSLLEDTETSLSETERFLDEHSGQGLVRPILTPRFAPTCSEKLLNGLGALAKKYACGVQTHLVESREEAAFALELYPERTCDAQIYEHAGLLGHGPAIFAHVIFPTEADLRILSRYDALSVHCPDATANITAGIMPVCSLQSRGFPVALGTDIGAGSGIPVYRQAARAVQLSKLKEFFEPEGNSRISFERAFYMATKAGGAVFDRVGALEKGYRFNALVLSGLEDPFAPLSPAGRLERFCYTGDDRNIIARYISGRLVTLLS